MENILVVDDSNTNLVLLEAVLTDENYKVCTASGAKEAYKQLSNNHIDLILLDLQMPKISGFEFLQEIKSNLNYKDIPVFVVSAIGEDKNRMKAISLGAELFIDKPVNLDKLTKSIKDFLLH